MVTTTKRKRRAPRSPDAKKTGPKPVRADGKAMSGAEREGRRQKKLAETLKASLTEAKAAREEMERLAESSQQAIGIIDALTETMKAAAAEKAPELVAVIDEQARAARNAWDLTSKAWDAAKRFNAALEAALKTSGKATGALKAKETEAEATQAQPEA